LIILDKAVHSGVNPQRPQQPQRQWAAFDGLRALAVLLVFWVHFSGSVFTEILRWPESAFKLSLATGALWGAAAMSWVGHMGVDLFFLLSGFLMCRLYVMPQINGQPQSWWVFLKKRFWRIYPAFLVCYLGSVWFRTQHAGWAFKWPDFATGFVFANAWQGSPWVPYAFVSWSLGYEAVFYVLIPACAWLALRRGPLVATLGFYVASLLLLPSNYVRFSALFLGAAMAAVSEDALRRWASRMPDVLACLLFALGMLAFVIQPTLFPPRTEGASVGTGIMTHALYIAATAGCACLVLRAQWGSGWLHRALCWEPAAWLGRVSYSFYLWHTVALGMVMVWVLPRLPQATTPKTLTYAVLAFVLSLLMSWLSYRFIEQRYFQNQAVQK
jgi:peptidoglycan/LPS O-acetylase OafA/YrhL